MFVNLFIILLFDIALSARYQFAVFACLRLATTGNRESISNMNAISGNH